jgi:hypothetical protein
MRETTLEGGLTALLGSDCWISAEAVVLETSFHAAWETSLREQVSQWRDWLRGIHTQVRFD